MVLRGLTHSLTSGTDVRLVLHFQNAGNVALTVPVLAKVLVLLDLFAARAVPERHAGEAHGHRAGAGGAASPSPGATPTPTPTATP